MFMYNTRVQSYCVYLLVYIIIASIMYGIHNIKFGPNSTQFSRWKIRDSANKNEGDGVVAVYS
jgi:hypothetical protein